MIPHNQTIVTIAPYSKRIGVAVFESDNLIKFNLKPIKLPRTKSAIELLVKKIFQDEVTWYKADLIVIKSKQTIPKNVTHFDIAFKAVLQEAIKANITLEPVLLKDAKKFLCPKTKVNEANVSKALCEKYPELKQIASLPTKDQTEYHRPLLVAVTLGFYQLSKISNAQADKTE